MNPCHFHIVRDEIYIISHISSAFENITATAKNEYPRTMKRKHKIHHNDNKDEIFVSLLIDLN